MSQVFSLVNIVLLFLLVWWVWRRLTHTSDKQLWLVYAVLKSLAACSFVWVYTYHYGTGDMANYVHDAQAYHSLGPSSFFQALFDPEGPKTIIDQLTYDFDRRAMLMAKFTAVSYYLSGNTWITALNFSLVGGLTIFHFFMMLKQRFPGLSLPAMGALLVLPSLVFWTSGICKEAISFPAMLLVLTPLLRLGSVTERLAWWHWVLAGLGAWTLWLLKYYIAAIFLPACLLYGLSTSMYWSAYRKLVVGLMTYVLLLLMVSQLHPNLDLHRTMQVMVDNYELTISQTQPGKSAHYNGLRPDVGSFIFHFPKAVFTGLFMPLISQYWDIPSFLVALQNSLLLITLLTLVVLITVRRKWSEIPAGTWAILGLIVLLAGLIAITTPNFGTLDRYRVAYQPFLVLLIAAGWQQFVLPRKII